MLLRVSSQLNWNSVDQNSESFKQFRKILIQVTNQSQTIDGQSHEDKNRDFLERQLIENWERIIDRNEIKNRVLYSPKDFEPIESNTMFMDLKRNRDHEAEGEDLNLIEILKKA